MKEKIKNTHNMKYNRVIEVLDEEHSKEVFKYWKSRNFDVDSINWFHNKRRGNEYRYYGLVNGVFGNYNKLLSLNSEKLVVPSLIRKAYLKGRLRELKTLIFIVKGYLLSLLAGKPFPVFKRFDGVYHVSKDPMFPQHGSYKFTKIHSGKGVFSAFTKGGITLMTAIKGRE